jgi:hypothetical protein
MNTPFTFTLNTPYKITTVEKKAHFLGYYLDGEVVIRFRVSTKKFLWIHVNDIATIEEVPKDKVKTRPTTGWFYVDGKRKA